MQKIFTLLLCALFVSTISAQKTEVYLPKASVPPVIGGEIDPVWAEAEKNNINKAFLGENPTLGESGETWWKGLWTSDGIYFLVYVADDNYYPFYQRVDETQTNQASFDQVQLFFDCNYLKIDGLGGQPGGNEGHYQIAPAIGTVSAAGYDDGTMHNDYYPNLGYQYSINAADVPHYFVEYFIPWISLKDKNGKLTDAFVGLGFEVVVIDNDSPGGNNDRNRMLWSNNQTGDGDCEVNMDDAGLMYLEDMQECFPTINLIGGEITRDNETLQIVIDACPENLLDGFKWVINEEETTARVRVSDDGVITPILDGVLKIKAVSSDGFVESNEITVIIIGQHLDIQEVSWIIDGLNVMPNEDGSPNNAWARQDGLNGHTAFVENGIFHFNSDSVLTTASSMKVRQVVNLPVEFADEEFLIVFKMWAEEETSFPLVLEDRNNDWNYWGTAIGTNTPNAVPYNGNTRWDLNVTTKPEWFRMHFIPSNINENSFLDFSFQPGLTGVKIMMDSLYLIAVKDSALIDWPCNCMPYDVVQNTQLKEINVYPNPANDILNVTFETGNTRVAIYNSVGIKMDEIFVDGTHHEFDIHNYSPGIYFVRANNAVVKFAK